MKLSILIPTIPARASVLSRLIAEFKRQGQGREEEFEIIEYLTEPYNKDDKATWIGTKRQYCLELAKGDAVVFFDDDDTPHRNYIPLILDAWNPDTDCIGFKVACYGYANGGNSPEVMEPADVSILYRKWANDQNGFKYVRCPHHIVPIKREHALAAGFPEIHHGEDHEYSLRLRDSGRLKNEAYIDEFMYTYMFDGKKKKGE